MVSFKCPICLEPAVKTPSPNANGEMMVMEEFDSCIEAFEVDISMYVCSSNKDHVFYMGK